MTAGKEILNLFSRRPETTSQGNYRLVGLTLDPGKVMKWVLEGSISGYMKEKVAGDSQRGFIKHRV